MATKIEYTSTVMLGDKIIDSIEVHGLFFIKLAEMSHLLVGQKRPIQIMQRARIKAQAHFMSAGARVIPDDAQISTLPVAVAKQILAALDNDLGEQGTVELEGDGIGTPIVYRLGTPLEMKDSKGGVTTIRDLEFLAKTYGELEDALACDNEMTRAVELLKTIAKPLDAPTLMRLPGWAIDRITNADGIGIMQKVCPAF